MRHPHDLARRSRVSIEEPRPWPDSAPEGDAVRTVAPQQPSDETPRMPAWVLFLMGIGLGVAGTFLLTGGTGPVETAPLVIPDVVDTTLPEVGETATAASDDVGGTRFRLPHDLAGGRLLAVVHGRDGAELQIWRPGVVATAVPLPDHSGSDLAVDASGSYYAFTGPSPVGFALYVGRAVHYTPVSGGVMGHAWHPTARGSLAWIETSDVEPVLRIAQVAQAEWTSAPLSFTLSPTTVAPVREGDWLVAHDDHGFVVRGAGEPLLDNWTPIALRRIGHDGVILAEIEVLDVVAEFGPTGHGVITMWNADGGQVPAILDPMLDVVVELGPRRDRLYGIEAAWSPDGTTVAIAEAGMRRSSGLTTWTVDGEQLLEVDLPASVGKISWSHDGSRIVAFIQTAQGATELAVVDATTGEVTVVPLPMTVRAIAPAR